MKVDKIYTADKKALKKSILLTVIGSIIGICILLKISDNDAEIFVLAIMYGPIVYLTFYNGLISEISMNEEYIGLKLIGGKGFNELYWNKVTMIIGGKVNYDRVNIQNGIYIAYKGMVGEDISMFSESYSIKNIVNNKVFIEDLRNICEEKNIGFEYMR